MASNKRSLQAYVRYDGTGRIIPGSLILNRFKPAVGNWQETAAYECCNYVPPTGCDCRPGQFTEGGVWNYFDCNGVNQICVDPVVCRDIINPCFDINQPYSGIEINTEAGWTCECSTTTTTTTNNVK